MKIKDIFLIEAPLPDDWDHSVYNEREPFIKRVQYAKERAKQIGRGSSRVTFKIMYQGRPTALKIALNRKGMAQNVAEVNILNDAVIGRSDVVIPLIDFDTKNSQPTWIHTEFATRMSNSQIDRFIPGEYNLINILDSIYLVSRRDDWSMHNDLPEAVTESPIYSELLELAMNVPNLTIPDLARKANWGLYKGRPVVIDLGLTDEVFDRHYRGR